jgi:hypothetical protein
MTQEEIAEFLDRAGYPTDEEGRVLVHTAPATLAFDPRIKNVMTGVRYCARRIMACISAEGDVDGCVAATPRCASSEPWMGDPNGLDCCPEECLIDYFNRRDGESAEAALLSSFRSHCYPGLAEFLAP